MVIPHPFSCKKRGKQGAHTIHRKSGFPVCLLQTGRRLIDLGIDFRMGNQQFQHFRPRRHRNRVSGQGSRLVYCAAGSHAGHHIPAAAVCRQRHSPAHDFTEGGKIRRHAVIALCPAESQTESGDHLIKNQQRPICIRRFTQCGKETFFGRNHAHVGRHRLHHNTGYLPLILFQ